MTESHGLCGGISCRKDATVEVNGRWYCPRHAAGKRRSLAADAARTASYVDAQEQRDQAEAIAKAALC
jgi:hypothetical protein